MVSGGALPIQGAVLAEKNQILRKKISRSNHWKIFKLVPSVPQANLYQMNDLDFTYLIRVSIYTPKLCVSMVTVKSTWLRVLDYQASTVKEKINHSFDSFSSDTTSLKILTQLYDPFLRYFFAKSKKTHSSEIAVLSGKYVEHGCY